MDRDDPIADARAVVAEFFPQARWSLLCGSVITSARTSGSDLDLVVLLPDGDPQAPSRQSRIFRTWPVELFVYDEPSLNHYLGKELPSRRPTLNRMVASGMQLTGDAAQIQSKCTEVLAAGPAPLTDAERDSRRYSLSDLLDDLTHAADPAERTAIAATTWTAAAEHALAFNRHWTGAGKWLLRELRALDPNLADRWLAAHGNPPAITAFAHHILDQAGGPLFNGYHVPGDRPTT
ncbi:nucleotidyltransferase domain-containing protein [Kribbella sp. NPDC020789]